jgi:imidazolonepropionase-like amidohydrolase
VPADGILRARRVFPATGDTVIHDGVVAFRDGLITDLGRARDFPDAVDLGDVTILPGFIDAHAHLSMPADGRGYAEIHGATDEELVRTGLHNVGEHLRCGVTTVRDNGARGSVGFAVARKARSRVLACGRPLTSRGGHFHFCGGEADSPEEIEAAVATLVDEGADHIKLIASGGGTPGTSPHVCSYTTAALRVAVVAAHARGRLTTAHCRSTESLRRAVAAGVDCVEHLDFLPDDPAPGAVVDYDPTLTARMRDAGTFASMTMQCGGWDTFVELATSAGLDPMAALTTAVPGAAFARLRVYFLNKLGVLRRLLDDGLGERIVLSTDAGPSDTRFGRFPWGLALAVQAGMAPRAALRAVTATAAEACGIADRAGTLRVGLAADLLVVDGDPTTRIEDAERVRAVLVGGQPFPGNAQL